MIQSFWTDGSGQTVDPDQTAPEELSDQDLHSLPFCVQLLDALPYGKAHLVLILE